MGWLFSVCHVQTLLCVLCTSSNGKREWSSTVFDFSSSSCRLSCTLLDHYFFIAIIWRRKMSLSSFFFYFLFFFLAINDWSTYVGNIFPKKMCVGSNWNGPRHHYVFTRWYIIQIVSLTWIRNYDYLKIWNYEICTCRHHLNSPSLMTLAVIKLIEQKTWSVGI